MSAFTPNLGLENPAYLSQVDAWGPDLNTSRSKMDQAIAGRSTWVLTGATFTITVAYNSVVPADPSPLTPVWIFTGTPGVTCTVTFAPNTAQKWAFCINQTNQSIIFHQGSGATATVVAGASNVVYFDGAGGTAAAAVFVTAATAPPGTVTNPSYSFTGFSDVGLYAPAAHTMGIAANNHTMAQFASTGAGPSGLNTLGVTLGPFIGNAFSNLDLFSGGWAGPTCPSGYLFLFFDESTSLIYAKYKDSGGTQHSIVIGSYNPSNLPEYVGAAPTVTVPIRNDYYVVNEAKTELDWYYKDSTGVTHGPIPVGGYGPNNLSTYAGAAPQTTANSNYWFRVNEAKTELDFYYQNSAGATFGPIPVVSYGPGNVAIYSGAAPATVINRDLYFVTDEGTGNINAFYQTSGGLLKGPLPIANYVGAGGWNNSFVPTFSDSSFNWTLISSQCMYQAVASTKSVYIQLLLEITTATATSGTFTISLPVSTYTGAGSFAQALEGGTANPGVILLSHFVAFGTSFTSDYNTLSGGAHTVFLQFNGVYQSN